MDTKTDTKPGPRMLHAVLPFGVQLGVHSSSETGSATIYHRTVHGRLAMPIAPSPPTPPGHRSPVISESPAPVIQRQLRMSDSVWRRGQEGGLAGTGQAVWGERRYDGEGIVTDVAPLHGVVIDEVLQVLQGQSQEARGENAADFLAAGMERGSSRRTTPAKASQWISRCRPTMGPCRTG
jgi:hypothetical protein